MLWLNPCAVVNWYIHEIVWPLPPHFSCLVGGPEHRSKVRRIFWSINYIYLIRSSNVVFHHTITQGRLHSNGYSVYTIHPNYSLLYDNSYSNNLYSSTFYTIDISASACYHLFALQRTSGMISDRPRTNNSFSYHFNVSNTDS